MTLNTLWNQKSFNFCLRNSKLNPHIPQVVLLSYNFKFKFPIKPLSYIICWNAKSDHHNRCIHTLTNSWLGLTLSWLIRSTHFLECSKRTSVPPHKFGLLGGKRLTFWQTIAPQLVWWNSILYLDTFHGWILTGSYLILLGRERRYYKSSKLICWPPYKLAVLHPFLVYQQSKNCSR
jgi:hypothetical protein